MYWIRSLVNIPNFWRAKFLHWVFFHSKNLSWKCVFIRWKTDKKRKAVFFYKKPPRARHILYSFVCVCVCFLLFEVGEMSRRVLQLSEGSVNTTKRPKVTLQTLNACTHRQTHACVCTNVVFFSKPLFEDKGKSCCSVPRRLFSSLYQTYTWFHSCR